MTSAIAALGAKEYMIKTRAEYVCYDNTARAVITKLSLAMVPWVGVIFIM